MKPEEFFEALSDIDESMVSRAKPFAEEETVEPLMVTPQKRGFKPFYAAAACIGAAAVGAAAVLTVNMSRSIDLPDSTVSDSSTAGTSDAADLGYKKLGQYPEGVDYVFAEDMSTVNIVYPIIDSLLYKNYKELADDSLMIVEGTLIDDTRQSSIDDLDKGKGERRSFNTLKVTKVLKGEELVAVNDEVVIAQPYIYEKCYGDYEYQLTTSSYLTPMIKGDRWIYFLAKSENSAVIEDFYYAIGNWQGRYPVPSHENSPFPYAENENGVVTEQFSTAIYNEIMVLHYGADANSLVQYNPNFAYVYTGDYSEITEFNRPKNILDPAALFGSYEELAAASDLVVTGKFTDDPHQDVDPDSPPDIPLGTNIFSQCKFEIEQVIKGDAKAGDVVVIQQSTGVYQGRLISTSQLTPMVKGDRWIYFLCSNPDSCVYYAANDSNARYLPPDCTANLNFAALGYDNNLGYSYGEYFNENIYSGLLSAMGYESSNTGSGVEKIFDAFADKNDYSTDRIAFSMREFPDTEFARSVSVNGTQYVEAVAENDMLYTLYYGLPVESVYLCDLNGDGKREICSTVYYGSGMIDSR
ncbi:MAG: hypothetical protein NC228_10695, partial [[Eubacterium] siraeum]|nr:hypothetical protein [[Eubacterium] siraeum]